MGKGSKKEKSSKVERVFSAGGVVFKKEKDELKFLIIKPAGKERWQLPKGLIEKGESSLNAAVREVGEEGGVNAEAVKKLGSTNYFFVWEGKKIFKTVTFYLMKFLKSTGRAHDGEVDEAQFFPFDNAYEKLTFKDDKGFLKQAKEEIERGLQETLI